MNKMSDPGNIKIYSHTKALCPECRKITDARIIELKNKIFLEKHCPADGRSQELICSDAQWYRESMLYIKAGQYPKNTYTKKFNGCPSSCGLCPEHQQHTCMPIIEILSSCNLSCPICLKNFKKPNQMTINEFKNILDHLKEYEAPPYIINLSGGEPTLHPDF